jgi:hypothetical protein
MVVASGAGLLITSLTLADKYSLRGKGRNLFGVIRSCWLLTAASFNNTKCTASTKR